MVENKKAIVLLSGGVDSTTVLAVAKHDGYIIYAMSFFYGQRHSCELINAIKISKIYNVVDHLIIDINLSKIGGSALTSDIDIPKGRDESAMKDIPITYVPARNTIFLSYALAWAEVLNVSDIFIGVNAVDYSGYPDCRPAFIEAFEKMAGLATKVGVTGETKLTIHTPLISLTKAQIIQQGTALGVDYRLSAR